MSQTNSNLRHHIPRKKILLRPDAHTALQRNSENMVNCVARRANALKALSYFFLGQPARPKSGISSLHSCQAAVNILRLGPPNYQTMEHAMVLWCSACGAFLRLREPLTDWSTDQTGLCQTCSESTSTPARDATKNEEGESLPYGRGSESEPRP
jgi:hypothetical protein